MAYLNQDDASHCRFNPGELMLLENPCGNKVAITTSSSSPKADEEETTSDGSTEVENRSHGNLVLVSTRVYKVH